jgi:hypothetical protein
VGLIASLSGTATAKECGVRVAEIRNLGSVALIEPEKAVSTAFVCQCDR